MAEIMRKAWPGVTESRGVWSHIFLPSRKSAPPIFLEVADMNKKSQEGNALYQGPAPQGMPLWEGGGLGASWYLILHTPCPPQAASGSLLSLTLNVHGNRRGKSLTEVPETQSSSCLRHCSSCLDWPTFPQRYLVSCSSFSTRIKELAVLIK